MSVEVIVERLLKTTKITHPTLKEWIMRILKDQAYIGDPYRNVKWGSLSAKPYQQIIDQAVFELARALIRYRVSGRLIDTKLSDEVLIFNQRIRQAEQKQMQSMRGRLFFGRFRNRRKQ